MNTTDDGPVPDRPGLDHDVLDAIAQTLEEIEIVLTHLSPAALAEISQILAEHANNYGGYGLLIDIVQFRADHIRRHIQTH